MLRSEAALLFCASACVYVSLSARVHILHPKMYFVLCLLESIRLMMEGPSQPPSPASAVGVLHGSVSTTAVCVEAVRRSIAAYTQ